MRFPVPRRTRPCRDAAAPSLHRAMRSRSERCVPPSPVLRCPPLHAGWHPGQGRWRSSARPGRGRQPAALSEHPPCLDALRTKSGRASRRRPPAHSLRAYALADRSTGRFLVLDGSDATRRPRCRRRSPDRVQHPEPTSTGHGARRISSRDRRTAPGSSCSPLRFSDTPLPSAVDDLPLKNLA